MKKDPYADIEFEKKHIVIKDKDGDTILDEYVEFPKDWDYNNCKIITEKYLCNQAKRNKELSVKDMFNRVSDTITEWGKKFGYFDSDEEADEFNYKLKYYQIRQYFAFNSPVYFNVGDRENPQASACFILSIEDDMDSITNVFHIEGRIFKQGSGSGINYSTLRSSKETVAGGGYACLTGDTRIPVFSRENDSVTTYLGEYTIEELFNNKEKKYYTFSWKNANDNVGLNEIKNVVYNGVQKVYEIVTESSKRIQATDNHRFLDSNYNWKELREFEVGEKIAVFHYMNAFQLKVAFEEIRSIEYIGEAPVYDIQMKEPYHNFYANGFVSHNSGPHSFLKGHDTFAGIIKSGGRLRRSAKMAILNVDHPDIYEWIDCKKREEEKLRALVAAGLVDATDIRYLDEVYYQNTNLSVRIPDKFMEAVINRGKWELRYVTTGEIYKVVDAYDLMKRIAEGVWRSGEPGVQFHDTINRENTCKDTMVINASNPCSEYMWCDNSSCNLASINLLKFYDPETDTFDVDLFLKIVELVITAQDIIVDGATYPTDEIDKNTKAYRALGLGYTNLGALLMRMRLPYNSENGRAVARAITALMQAKAIDTSAALAEKLGPYKMLNVKNNKKHNREVLSRQYQKHLRPFIAVIRNEFDDRLKKLLLPIVETAEMFYLDRVVNVSDEEFLQRNAQLTLLAPTGTISFIMGAETTGIEPDYSIVKYKTMADTGETVQFVNKVVEPTLKDLGFDEKTIEIVLSKFRSGLSASKIEELGPYKEIFFDAREIHYKDHLRMMAAVQPFLSGSISKTVNVPEDITIEELIDLYIYAWRLGLKSVIVYRDNSKNFQVLTDKKLQESKEEKEIEEEITEEIDDEDDDIMKQYHIVVRRKLPDEVEGGRHKFRIGDFKGYLNYSVFPGTNQLAEFFINVSKQGTTISGLLDALAMTTSLALQYGLPLKVWVQKMLYQKFEPAGFTSNKDIRFATSIVDYFAKYFGKKFLTLEEQYEVGLITAEEYQRLKGKQGEKVEKEINGEKQQNATNNNSSNISGSICPNCGSMMRRLGTCDFCDNCGFNFGSCS